MTAEQERKAKNAVALEAFKLKYQEMVTMQLSMLKGGSSEYIAKAEAARQKYLAERKREYQHNIDTGVRHGLGYAMQHIETTIDILRNRPTAHYWNTNS